MVIAKSGIKILLSLLRFKSNPIFCINVWLSVCIKHWFSLLSSTHQYTPASHFWVVTHQLRTAGLDISIGHLKALIDRLLVSTSPMCSNGKILQFKRDNMQIKIMFGLFLNHTDSHETFSVHLNTVPSYKTPKCISLYFWYDPVMWYYNTFFVSQLSQNTRFI